MKKIIEVFVLVLFVLTMNAQEDVGKNDKNVVQNVVLINSMPWEVLMSKGGDILAKLKYLPDFLKGYDVNWEKDTNYEPPVPIVNKQVQNNNTFNRQNDFNKENKFPEIYFQVGSALLKNKQIQELNELAQKLISNPSLVYRLFGFVHEPETRASILGKRRMDAVMAYLRVKGVNVDRQVIRDNVVNGQNNKIVFASK